jgi:hypothetical protein
MGICAYLKMKNPGRIQKNAYEKYFWASLQHLEAEKIRSIQQF